MIITKMFYFTSSPLTLFCSGPKIAVVVQAEQFNDAIHVVRNWLPEAEAELKLHSVPDDEDSIMQAIENHEVRHASSSSLLVI